MIKVGVIKNQEIRLGSQRKMRTHENVRSSQNTKKHACEYNLTKGFGGC